MIGWGPAIPWPSVSCCKALLVLSCPAAMSISQRPRMSQHSSWFSGKPWPCIIMISHLLTYEPSIFSSLGEFGPGDNIGLCCAKSSATAVRGQFYAIAAAAGKIGAFVGTYVIPIIQDNAPNKVRSGQDPFFVSSSLCIFSAALAFFLLPNIGQVCHTFGSVQARE